MKSPIFHLFFPGRTTKRKEKNYLTNKNSVHMKICIFFFCLEPTHGVHTNSVYTERETHGVYRNSVHTHTQGHTACTYVCFDTHRSLLTHIGLF